ncbi:hypothetical protein HOP50_05g38950 [Chloropicon primus]|uniref:F420-0:Gamma-glutamyl ligase n=1 Tax=Chloropicon primus TaxID=1764295 RepID=A0A5B8MP51_9CHLO|nr:hypothetical protein A3770_05p38830 [Chloropicon primus]UPR00580.1 hypothetical protein HOP50_05g38950 [Chloropicon primus]|eukprot:QDZ21365.1 hypothetical protein A3770_05p38830 [Chloropicon primus]
MESMASSTTEGSRTALEEDDREELEELLSVYGRGGPKLVLTRGIWEPVETDGGVVRLKGVLMFKNESKRQELFVPEVRASARVLSKGCTDGVLARVNINPRHDLSDGYGSPDSTPREDGYWSTYILQGGSKTYLELAVELVAQQRSTGSEALSKITACCVEVDYECYGPSGLSEHKQHVVIPVDFPDPSLPPLEVTDLDQSDRDFKVYSIPTHLLFHGDDPLSVVEKYVKPHAVEGDIVVVAETPLAIMQGRYRHPSTIKPSLLARVLCKLFHPTSSVATACGMQALLDLVGPLRAILAAFLGVLCRALRLQRGVFYKVAGEQASLLDDISGTIAPYDKFICLGPRGSDAFVRQVKQRFGLSAAVVDVNDLSKKTKMLTILARTRDVDEDFVREVLLPNPAGNADQQTPFVLIRPASPQQGEAA